MLNRNRDLDRLPLEIGRQSIIRSQLVTVKLSDSAQVGLKHVGYQSLTILLV
jgi:hypothetical protein